MKLKLENKPIKVDNIFWKISRPILIITLIIFAITILFMKNTKSDKQNTDNINQIDECIEIEKNLDLNRDTIILQCLNSNKLSIFGGGRIKSITSKYIETEKTFLHTVIISTQSKDHQIIYKSNNNPPKYEVGNYYKFNLNNFCPLAMSSANSGLFSNKDENKLVELNCP